VQLVVVVHSAYFKLVVVSVTVVNNIDIETVSIGAIFHVDLNWGTCHEIMLLLAWCSTNGSLLDKTRNLKSVFDPPGCPPPQWHIDLPSPALYKPLLLTLKATYPSRCIA